MINKNFFQTIVDNLPQVVWLSDSEGSMLFFNKAWYSLTGRSEKESLGTAWLAGLHATDRSSLLDSWNKAQVKGCSFREECRVSTPDMGYKNVLFFGTQIVFNENRNHWVGVTIDITERKQLEMRVRGAERMEAVGRLAGGFAHDFNNLLSVIENYSHFLLESVSDKPDLIDDLNAIQEAVKRGSVLTKQLLAFSRQQILQPEFLNVNSLINGLRNILRRSIGDSVKVTIDLEEKPRTVKADRNQIERVIVNLVMNARDAMEQGGHLGLRTYSAIVDSPYAAKHPGMRTGSFVVIEVSDSGTGMTEEVKARVFEPFFSTKDKSQGTGLGLSTAYGIVKQSGGYIAVESVSGEGTTFKVFLPTVKAVDAGVAVQRIDRISVPSQQTILLVEDDEVVRRATRRALLSGGYRVEEAKDGVEALDLFKKKQDYDLLLTDIMMPKMDGLELSREVEDSKPDMPILLMSGFNDHVFAQNQKESLFSNGLLAKPFGPKELLHKVKEVLDRVY